MLYRQFMIAAGVVPVALAMVGCGSDRPTELQSTAVFTSLFMYPTSMELFSAPPGNNISLSVTAYDQNNYTISGLGTPSFSTSNAAVAKVSSGGVVTAVAEGSAQITASLTSAGTTRTVLAVVTVQNAAAQATVTAPDIAFSPSDTHIAAGGTVTWMFETVPHNVTFGVSDTLYGGFSVPAGAPWDIGTMSNSSETRAFPVRGTFVYTCTQHLGMTGTVIVH